jgi:integrase
MHNKRDCLPQPGCDNLVGLGTLREPQHRHSTARPSALRLSPNLEQLASPFRLRVVRILDLEPRRRQTARRDHLSAGPFTTDDAQQLAETARVHFPRWYPFVLCGLRTGARVGELSGLEWGDIDWRARTIRIRRNFTHGEVTTPKSHQCRTVDLSPQLRAVLPLARQQRRIEFLRHAMSLPEPVFPSDEGTRLDPSNVGKVFTKICAKADLRRRTPHDMRHSYASLLLSANVPILYVSAQLGHSNSVITLRTYAAWMPKTDAHAHNAVLDTRAA